MRVDLTNYLDTKISDLGVASIEFMLRTTKESLREKQRETRDRTREKTSTRENIIMYYCFLASVPV